MRSVLEDMKDGAIGTYEVPVPELRAKGILVRTRSSAISAGTERVKIETGSKSLLEKALARPDLVRQVLEYAKINGIKAAYHKVHSKLGELSALGYSSAGVVLAVGEGVTEFAPGNRVACAGAGYANHCEVNFIPRNLAVKIPDGVSFAAASLTTIGAIAMQGLRQAQLGLGETVAIIGAGLLGVLTIQLGRAAGYRVIAVDVNPARVNRSVAWGAQLAVNARDQQLVPVVRRFSKYGVDAAIITASSKTAEPLELAAGLLRDRGRIVVVGDVGLGVSRSPVYHKEVSIALSRSYGPGRYDPSYEEGGVDYPIGYVRWTEQRNMEAFLNLLAQGSINVEPLLSEQYPIEQAAAAYEKIREGEIYTAVLNYAEHPFELSSPKEPQEEGPRPAPKNGVLRVACIGAGSFAKGVLFPILQNSKRVALYSVATASGASAESCRRSYGFEKAVTVSDAASDPSADMVMVLSRHDSHSQHVVEALKHHKPVFVEKPLAVSYEELACVSRAYRARKEEGKSPFLMVGFNRRFAPYSVRAQEFFRGRKEAMALQIRINAGYLPHEHWSQATENGGRLVGEACHFIDWARFIVGAPIESVYARALPDMARYNRDNVSMTLRFLDGSLATILYLSNGDRAVPKEQFEVFCEGAIGRIDDFRSLELARGGKVERLTAQMDKGHKRELELTVEAIVSGNPSPIPFEEIEEVSCVTLAVLSSLDTGLPVVPVCDRLRVAQSSGKAVEGM